MNRILLDSPDTLGFLPPADWRVVHIRETLKGRVGDILKAGIVNGVPGTMEICTLDERGLAYRFEAEGEALPLSGITPLLAMSRPPVMRRLIRDLTTIGVERLIFFPAQLSEGSYLKSRVWKETEKLLREGAMQGGATLLPELLIVSSLKEGLKEHLPEKSGCYLHNSGMPLSINDSVRPPLLFCVGPERGWSDFELTLFEEYHLPSVSLGKRILRCETAAIIGCALLGDF